MTPEQSAATGDRNAAKPLSGGTKMSNAKQEGYYETHNVGGIGCSVVNQYR